MTVPTTGMKLRGRYITYLTSAVGLNFEKGFFIILPSLAIGSLPGWSWRPSLSTPVAFLETRVPSKVSNKASCTRKLRERRFTMVELSLRIKRAVVKGAKGPFTKTRIASWGKYVKKNMKPSVPAVSVSVGTIREVKGFHNALWVKKYAMPLKGYK